MDGFQMSLLDLSQLCKIAFIETREIWNFWGTVLVYICVKNAERVQSFEKIIKILKLEEY